MAPVKKSPAQVNSDNLLNQGSSGSGGGARPSNRGKKLRIVVEQPLSSLTQRPTLWPLVQFDPDCEVCDKDNLRYFEEILKNSGISNSS